MKAPATKHQEVIDILEDLSGRWTIPILVHMEDRGDRFTVLQNRMKITPARLNDNLKKLITMGYVKHLRPQERRHPLLPEYQLTDKGHYYKQFALVIHQVSKELALDESFHEKWNLSILITVMCELNRFSEIKKALSPITPKVLSKKLTILEERGLLEKSILSVSPVTTVYDLSEEKKVYIKSLYMKIINLLDKLDNKEE